MSRRRVLFISGTRADWGKIKNCVDVCKTDFECCIFATGMHQMSKYGLTINEILKAGIAPVYPFINQTESSSMPEVLASTITGLNNYLSENCTDLIVVHGDRVEALAGATVGALANIPVAHIEGGERSGTIDDSIRHAITKFAHIHFVSNEEAKTRCLQLGECPESIHVIGSPDLDLMSERKVLPMSTAQSYYQITFKRYGIAMFHPVTTEVNDSRAQARAFFSALRKVGDNFIVVYPNNDLGSDEIIYEIERLSEPNFKVFRSLRFEFFLSLLKNSDYIIGNSSAGIREAPFFEVPTVNVGSRQRNRSTATSIFNCDYDEQSICSAVSRLKAARDNLVFSKSEFGAGNAANLFHKTLLERDWNSSLQKHFRDI